MDAERLGQIALGIARLFTSPSASVYWPYLLSAAVLALGVYVRGAGSRRPARPDCPSPGGRSCAA